MKYLSNRSLVSLGLGVSLAACAASADDDGARAAAATNPGGVNAQAGENGVSASAPGVSAQANRNGASASAGPVDVATAQQALTELTGNVDVSVDGFKSGSTTTTTAPPPPPAGAAGSGTRGTRGSEGTATQALNVPCADGGDADVDGYVNVVPVPVVVDVKVAIAFNACAMPSGTTVDGNIDFSQTVITGPETPLQIETLYQGDVTLTGKVNVTCPVDLNVVVDETGRAVKVEGQFCNRDASELNLQIQPRWAAAK